MAVFECDSEPFYLFDDTAHIASFGRHDDDNARSIGRAWRAGAVEADGFWAARDGQYRLYKWDYNGVLVDSIVRRVPWFPDHNITPFRQGVRPGPIIRDIRIDNRRRLWVVTLVAAPEWADQFRDAPAPDMRFNWNMEGYFDSVLEVIDLNTRRVIAHARFPEYVSRITNTFQLVAEKEDAIGEPFLDVWDVTLPRR